MSLYDERLKLADEITRRLLAVCGEAIHAVGLYGSMAHGDIVEESDLDFVVITKEDAALPVRSVLLGGIYINLDVFQRSSYLQSARDILPQWTEASDRFVTTLPLHDPQGFFDLLRETHEQAASTSPQAFLETSRSELLWGLESLQKADRALSDGRDPAALVCLVRGLVFLSDAVGLLSRTRWRGARAAVPGAAEAGREIDGFSEPFALAIDDRRPMEEQVSNAWNAARALQAHLAAVGVVIEVNGVDEWLPLPEKDPTQALRDQVGALEAEVQRLEETTQAERDQVGALEAEIQLLEETTQAERDQVGALEAEIQLLHSSKSFRYTAPLRAVWGAIRSTRRHPQP